MRPDLVLAGGGLANGLIAYRLAQLRPELSVLVLESGAEAGGNHTWSFHATDLTPAQAEWVDPFVVHRWPGHDVAFPGFGRRVGIGYRSVTSERFAALLRDKLGERLRCRTPIVALEPERVVLAGGETIEAGVVVDGRGPAPAPTLELACQVFLGHEVVLARPHRLDRPILMDATVPQVGGYRFMYVLPLAPDRLLIEDTYYTENSAPAAETLRARIAAYAGAHGWDVREVVREEIGILPLAIGGDIEAFWNDGVPGLPRSGLRAGLFHAVTGYSLPEAVKVADHLASLPDLSAPALHDAIRTWSIGRWREARFFRLLNRMLFRAGEPAERFRVLRRFYGLPEGTIGRFYAGALSPADKLRLLAGKPPVPIGGAIRALLSSQSFAGRSAA